MSWFSLLQAILSVAGSITRLLERKQLLDAGSSQAIQENLHASLEKIKRVNAVKPDISPDGVLNDPNRRDD